MYLCLYAVYFVEIVDNLQIIDNLKIFNRETIDKNGGEWYTNQVCKEYIQNGRNERKA